MAARSRLAWLGRSVADMLVWAAMTHPLTRAMAAVLLLAALAWQFWALYLAVGTGPPPFAHADKVVHVILFAVPVLIAPLAGVSWRVAAAVMAAHAPISELIQHLWLPGRTGDPWDVVADLVGVTGAALTWWFVGRRRAAKL